MVLKKCADPGRKIITKIICACVCARAHTRLRHFGWPRMYPSVVVRTIPRKTTCTAEEKKLNKNVARTRVKITVQKTFVHVIYLGNRRRSGDKANARDKKKKHWSLYVFAMRHGWNSKGLGLPNVFRVKFYDPGKSLSIFLSFLYFLTAWLLFINL